MQEREWTQAAVVDTLGLILSVAVHTASIQDQDDANLVIWYCLFSQNCLF